MSRILRLALAGYLAPRTRTVPRLLAVASAFAFAIPAQAQYSFVRIDAGNLTGVYPGTLNNYGVVAFTGHHAGNAHAVYKGAGGPLTTIAATGPQFTFFNAATINCAGDVGFRGLGTTINGIYRGNGGPLTLIHSASNGVFGAHVDEDGTMALLNNSIGVMTGNGGPTTTIAAYGGVFNGFNTDPDIRNGTVAFMAELTNGQSAIYTSTAGVLTQIAASGGPFLNTQLPRIGCSGNLVWISNVSSGGQAIRTHINGVTSTFVDTAGPYAQFGFYFATGINSYNQVAFSATLDASPGLGIYTGSNPITDKVVQPGDPLAGKVVRDAYFGGLNDIGQISFGVYFTDFTYGMFRADPAVPNQDPDCCDIGLPCTTAPGECCSGRPSFSDPAYASFGNLVSVGTASPQAQGSAVVSVFDLVNPNGGPFNTDFGAPIYSHSSWSQTNLGSVFGVTLDPAGNIYVASTTCYDSDIIGSLGNVGAVYKLDTTTSAASLFATLPNTGPALGNMCYDCEHEQFFVSNMDDGKIYRIDSGGVIQGSPFDFGAADNPSNVFPPLGDRVWAVQSHNGRLYFSVWWEDWGNQSATRANEIWSIALDGAGDFLGAPTREISMPTIFGSDYSNPVSDIRFTPTGTLLAAERGMESETKPTPHVARLLEFECAQGVWTSSANSFSVGEGGGTNSAGGVDMDHDTGGRVYVTGDALQLGPQQIYGTQGLPATGGNIANSILVDFNGNLSIQDKTFIGDVAVTCPCTPPPSNMRLWLPFDETSGGPGAVTQNLINTAGNGTLAGPGAAYLGTPGEVVRAVCFDQGQVNVPHYAQLFLNSDFTIDAWIRPNAQAAAGWKYTIVDKRQFLPLGQWRGFWMYLDGALGELRLEFRDGAGPVNVTTTGPLVALNGPWRHVAITLKRNCGGTGNVCVDFWLDGVQGTAAYFTGVTGQIGNTAPLRVGDDLPVNPDHWFLGCIDELEIFGRALSHTEIHRVYVAFERGKCKSPPPPWNPICYPGLDDIIPCPCANPPTGDGTGCNNFGPGPAESCELSATGTASIGADTVVLTSTGENNTSTTIFIQGPTSSATGVVFGAGVRCVTGGLKRLYTGPAAGGSISRPGGADPGVSSRSAAVGDPLAAGDTRYYMTYYRDPQASGPCSNAASTFNCSNSGGITWQP